MEAALEKLRDEVGSLQKEEQSKLEEEKKKALERLQKMVRLSYSQQKKKKTWKLETLKFIKY